MTNRHTLSLLEAYLDQELHEPERREVEEHLAECAECRSALMEMKRLRELLGTVPADEPDEQYWSETQSIILARTVANAEPERTREPAGPPSAAARRSFTRSLVSALVSLFVLFSAISIGSLHQQEARVFDPSGRPVLVTAPVRDVLGRSLPELFTPRERMRLAQGMLLIGPPGVMGRFMSLTILELPVQ